MESQAGRDEPNQRRLGIDLDAGEISVPLKIPFALMAADAQPIVHRLHWQLNIFRSFQFDHYQSALPRDAEQIEHATITRRQRGNLRIKIARIDLRVEFCGIFEDDAFPASALGRRDRARDSCRWQASCDAGRVGAAGAPGRVRWRGEQLREFPSPKKILGWSSARIACREKLTRLACAGRTRHWMAAGLLGSLARNSRICALAACSTGFHLVARDQPAFQVSGVGGVHFLHRGVRARASRRFRREWAWKEPERVHASAAGPLRDEKRKPSMARRSARLAHRIQPQNSKGQNAFDGGGVFAGRQRPVTPSRVRTFLHDAADVGAGEANFRDPGRR